MHEGTTARRGRRSRSMMVVRGRRPCRRSWRWLGPRTDTGTVGVHGDGRHQHDGGDGRTRWHLAPIDDEQRPRHPVSSHNRSITLTPPSQRTTMNKRRPVVLAGAQWRPGAWGARGGRGRPRRRLAIPEASKDGREATGTGPGELVHGGAPARKREAGRGAWRRGAEREEQGRPRRWGGRCRARCSCERGGEAGRAGLQRAWRPSSEGRRGATKGGGKGRPGMERARRRWVVERASGSRERQGVAALCGWCVVCACLGWMRGWWA